jgi:hypothetical protein
MKLMSPKDLGRIVHSDITHESIGNWHNSLKYRHLAFFNENISHKGVALLFTKSIVEKNKDCEAIE